MSWKHTLLFAHRIHCNDYFGAACIVSAKDTHLSSLILEGWNNSDVRLSGWI